MTSKELMDRLDRIYPHTYHMVVHEFCSGEESVERFKIYINNSPLYRCGWSGDFASVEKAWADFEARRKEWEETGVSKRTCGV